MSNEKTNYTNDELYEYTTKMRTVIQKLRDLIDVDVPMTQWVSPQKSDGRWYAVTAILGGKPDYHDVTFDFEVLDTLKPDVLARNAFNQIYGFKPDSYEDRQRKIEYYKERIAGFQNTIQSCERSIAVYEYEIAKLGRST